MFRDMTILPEKAEFLKRKYAHMVNDFKFIYPSTVGTIEAIAFDHFESDKEKVEQIKDVICFMKFLQDENKHNENEV